LRLAVTPMTSTCGISKVNIATDLEHALLTALGRTERMKRR
jgi:fructose/tagatose bisphosphate aldolase